MYVWSFLDLCLLAAGAIMIAFSIIWRAPDLLRDLIISDLDLTIGLVLGIAFISTFVISIGAIIQRNHITIGLVILNWALVGCGIADVVIGSIIWFFTLQERANFHQVLQNADTSTRQQVQDLLSCCGYFNSTDLGVNAGFCSDPTFAAAQTPCVTPFTAHADYTLNNIFTTIYGFMSILVCLFLATICVINKRLEVERFRKIDAKRGGRGFV